MGSVYLRGNSYVGQYKDRGRTVQKTLGKKGVITKTSARAILAKLEEAVTLKKYDLLDTEVPRLSDFSAQFIEYQRDIKQKRSWKKDQSHIKRFNNLWGGRLLSEIKVKDIDDYKLIRLQKVKPATVNRELEVLRHLYYLAEKWNLYYGKNPVAKSGLLKVDNQKERILTFEEEQRLLDKSSSHLVPILITAINTGMRKMEVITLTWEDIDFENNLITVRKEISKSKKVRRIPINSRLRKTLLEQKIKTQHAGYVFLTPEGEPYSSKNHSAFKRAFSTACKRAGIEGLRVHDLRHTAATRMVENTGNIVAVSKILGHADLKITMRYAHPDSSLVEAVESLSDDFSKSYTDKFTDIKVEGGPGNGKTT